MNFHLEETRKILSNCCNVSKKTGKKRPGASFSFSQNYTQADAVPTSAPSVGAVGNFSDITSHAAGTAGSLAGTITSQGVMTLTAGGAGTTATGQFVSEIVVD